MNTGNQRKILLISDDITDTKCLYYLAQCNFPENEIIGIDCIPVQLANGMVADVWNLASDPKYYGLREAYYLRSQGVVIMTCDPSSESINKTRQDILRQVPDLKIREKFKIMAIEPAESITQRACRLEQLLVDICQDNYGTYIGSTNTNTNGPVATPR